MDPTVARPVPDPLELGKRLVVDVLEPMKRTFVGKDEIIDLIGIALIAGENLFLLGPPGTAKSAVIFELGRCLLRVVCESVPDDRLGDVLHAGWKLGVAAAAAADGDADRTRFDADDVRTLNKALADVDLSEVVAPLANLVLRLRNAGMAFSD